MEITEALLEMHFHRAIIDCFCQHFGAHTFRFLKPSSRGEAWVGFDQGWVWTSIPTDNLLEELKGAIQAGSASSGGFYLGFFLQFKVVKRMERKSIYKPERYDMPYFRAELSLSPIPTTGISQHETLMRLCRINGASVSYACGMLFDDDDVWERPDLEKLRCVDISSSPVGWATNQRHFLTFAYETDPEPFWCSEPSQGRSFSLEEWATGECPISPRKMTGEQLYRLIQDAYGIFHDERDARGIEYSTNIAMHERAQPLPSSFTIVQFGL